MIFNFLPCLDWKSHADEQKNRNKIDIKKIVLSYLLI